MRTVLYLSPLRKLCSKIEPVSTFRSLALITAPALASLMCSTLTTSSSWPSISNIVPLRKSLVEINQELHRTQVGRETETGVDAPRGPGRDARRPKLLSGVNVGDVNLDGWHGKRWQASEESERVMR